MTAVAVPVRGRRTGAPSVAAPLHPGVWWAWAIGLGAATTRTSNPLLLGLVAAVAWFVVAARRTAAPWAAVYGVFVRLGLLVIAIRTVFHALMGAIDGPTVLFHLPEVTLPAWADGVAVGGPVTLEGLVLALYDGLRLAVLLACVGAANALANPRRLLRSLPAALYEVSVAVVVALSLAPQLVVSTSRVRRARQLRGDTARGWRSLRSVLVPVLETAFERSLLLAASMDSRGYGRRGAIEPGRARLTAALLLGGMFGLTVGAYGLLDAATDDTVGIPLLLAGAVLAVVGLRVGAHRVHRTRYRPDAWRWRETVVALSGVAAVVAILVAEHAGTTGLVPPTFPVSVPALPLLPAAGILAGVLPAVVAPRERAVIRFDAVGVTYAGATTAVLRGVDTTIPEGELWLVAGRTGSGKSTLLRTVNGLVPHFSGGTLHGRVTVDGRDTATSPPRELADVVGIVLQEPAAGFVTDVVEDELAYSLESLGLAPATMRRRVEEVVDLLGLGDLRDRSLLTLSGGQQQRVAIGAALTAQPRILVLDEPTSALDPGGAEEVLAALHRLVHDIGLTVLVAEHRIERVVQFADRVLWLPGSGAAPIIGEPGPTLRGTPVAPPVVRLGELAGWDAGVVSVRAARRLAEPLRARLAAAPVPAVAAPAGPVRLRAAGLVVRHPGVVALRGVDLDLHGGEVVAVMGRNGSGKSSLLWALQGTGRRHGGTVAVDGDDPARLEPGARRSRVGLVPQEHGDLLYLETVAAELAQTDRETGAAPGTARQRLDDLVPDVRDDVHPRDLSEGQQLGLALAIALTAAPGVVLLDEPTRGLDYTAKARLAAVLRSLAAAGAAVAVATHDVEFVAEVADRVVLLADGELVADAPADEFLAGSPMFAPQVAKVVAPARFRTVEQVEAAIA